MPAIRRRPFAIAQTILRALNRTSSATMPLATIETLLDQYELVAASFYSYSDIPDEKLILRAQVGLSYSSYESFVLPIDSTAGRCIDSLHVQVIADVGDEIDFRDKNLIAEFGLRTMLAVPLTAGEEPPNKLDTLNSLGVICVYPQASSSLEQIDILRTDLEDLRSIIAETYLQSIQLDKLRLREQVTQRAVASADLNSFLHRVCRLLQDEWPYEAASVFIHDERADILRLGATTGYSQKISKQEVVISLNDENDDVAATFRTGVTTVVGGNSLTGIVSNAIHESIAGIARATILIPLYEPSNAEARRTIGVLRVVNKLLRHDQRIEVFSFGWEDFEFLTFVCDVVGVVASMFDRVSKSKDDFERSLHGVQNNLNGVLTTLDFLNGLMSRRDTLSLEKYAYMVPTAKAQVQALCWQAERFSRRDEHNMLKPMKCDLLSDVFAKLGPLLRPLADSFATPIGSLPTFNKIFAGCPSVQANPDELITVFRNLFENSIKYSKRRRPGLEITISWEIADTAASTLKVIYRDNGIGILEKDSGRIFYEGFRSENAMRRCQLGAGLGLFQSKEILARLNGSIVLSNRSTPTEFTIIVPIWRD